MKKRNQSHRGASKKSFGKDGAPKNNRESGGRFLSLIIFTFLVVLLAIVLAFLILPSKYTGRTKESRKTDAASSHSGEGEGRLEGHESDCMVMIAETGRIVETHPQSEWDSAIGLLAECIHREPENSAAYWSLAITLLRRGDNEDGTKIMSEAIRLDPQNKEYLKSSGFVFAGLEMYSLAIFSLERYLELVLQVASWEELLASISMQRENELGFIHDAGEDIVRILEVLQSASLKDMALIKVTVYNLLINYS